MSGYPGSEETVARIEATVMPPCPLCASDETAEVSVGIVGRSIHIAAQTKKIRLIPNGPRPGDYFCRGCQTYFNAPPKKTPS